MNSHIVDCDNTILDTEKIKTNIVKKIINTFGDLGNNIFWEEYKKTKQLKGFVDIPFTAEKMAEQLGLPSINGEKIYKLIFMDIPFNEFFLPGAEDFLKVLKKDGRLIMYSLGDQVYQKDKIRLSGLVDIIGEENIIITHNKLAQTQELINDLKEQGFTNLFFYNDNLIELDEAHKVDPEIKCVWVQHGNRIKKEGINTSFLYLRANTPRDIHRMLFSQDFEIRSQKRSILEKFA